MLRDYVDIIKGFRGKSPVIDSVAIIRYVWHTVQSNAPTTRGKRKVLQPVPDSARSVDKCLSTGTFDTIFEQLTSSVFDSISRMKLLLIFCEGAGIL